MKSIKYVNPSCYTGNFLCVAFMNCSESALHIKSSRKCPIQPKRNKNGSWNECSENTERAVIIEKNPEALLQRVRLIKNAKRKLFFLLLHFNPMKVEN